MGARSMEFNCHHQSKDTMEVREAERGQVFFSCDNFTSEHDEEPVRTDIVLAKESVIELIHHLISIVTGEKS